MEKNNKLMMFVIIALLLALLGTVVGVSLYAVKFVQDIQNPMNSQNSETGFVREPAPQLNMEDIGKIAMGGEAILTNLAVGEDGKSGHFVQVRIQIGYDKTKGKESTAMQELLEDAAEMDFIRSIVLRIVRNKTYEEMLQTNSADDLSKQILERLQDEYKSNLIVGVYFTDWLVY